MGIYLVEQCGAFVRPYANVFENNTVIYSNCQPLHAAVSSGNINLVRFLIEKTEVDVNATSSVSKCNFAADDSVLRQNFYAGKNTPLHYATFYLDGELLEVMVSYLIKNGADVSARNEAGQIPFALNAVYENTSRNFLAVQKEFFQAIEEGDLDRCQRVEKLMIGSEASYLFSFVTMVNSKNVKGESPLIISSYAGNLNVVHYLVKHCKANVNKEAILYHTEFKYWLSVRPLHAAVLSGNIDLVKFLVEDCHPDMNSRSGSPIGDVGKNPNE